MWIIPHAIGAYWGEVNTTIHKGFGMSGALTNGVMRDLGDLAPGFPGDRRRRSGPATALSMSARSGQPVTIFGLTVRPGDLVHADRHGAVVIPPEVVARCKAAIAKMQETERLVLDPARAARL